MMNHEQILAAVDRHREKILAAERWLWAHPETGYREWQTHAWLAEQFEALGYTLRPAGNIPGFVADIDTGRPGPCVAVFGEMDSLIIAEHPDADPDTHAVHACGHHAQCAGLLGVAAALKEPGMLDGLSGSVRLCAVPAEELIEIEYREELRRQGVIRYLGGKVEFLHRGLLDGVDMAFMLHTSAGDSDFYVTKGSNGCIVKNVAYQGRAIHASQPYWGINALYAANLGMQAINALRETFRDEEHIRVHPIITAGGAAVNAIPSDVRMESYVRGENMDAIVRANRKVNRALAASAAALGAKVELRDIPGYFPMHNDPTLMKYFMEVSETLSPGRVEDGGVWSMGCTDMGDMSSVMPIIQPYACGAAGGSHGANYCIKDPVRACVNAAKAQTLLLHRLLQDDAAAAREVKVNARPPFATRKEYFAAVDALRMDQQAVIYEEDGSVTLRYK